MRRRDALSEAEGRQWSLRKLDVDGRVKVVTWCKSVGAQDPTRSSSRCWAEKPAQREMQTEPLVWEIREVCPPPSDPAVLGEAESSIRTRREGAGGRSATDQNGDKNGSNERVIKLAALDIHPQICTCVIRISFLDY